MSASERERAIDIKVARKEAARKADAAVRKAREAVLRKRDRFAAAAITAFDLSSDFEISDANFAKDAFDIADAMLVESAAVAVDDAAWWDGLATAVLAKRGAK